MGGTQRGLIFSRGLIWNSLSPAAMAPRFTRALMATRTRKHRHSSLPIRLDHRWSFGIRCCRYCQRVYASFGLIIAGMDGRKCQTDPIRWAR